MTFSRKYSFCFKIVYEEYWLQGTLAPVLDILTSPVTRGYRNKCEFSVGYMESAATLTESQGEDDADMGDTPPPPPTTPVISVGFRLATYKKGDWSSIESWGSISGKSGIFCQKRDWTFFDLIRMSALKKGYDTMIKISVASGPLLACHKSRCLPTKLYLFIN